jgi:hypothetical protein
VNLKRLGITSMDVPAMPEENDPFDLPLKLHDALRAAYTHRAQILPSVDEAILAAAHSRFDRRRRLRLLARWGGGLAAGLAAVIVLVISLNRPAPAKALAKGDVNADGQLNMVDALSLARHIAAHDHLEKTWDVNGDGAIDQKDIDAIASAAVSLKQRGLAQRSLPTLADLGITRIGSDVGSASADVLHIERPKTFAKANPTENKEEYP